MSDTATEATPVPKAKTHVLLLVDESGSMDHLASDTRGGFASYLDSLTADKAAKYRVTVGLFNTDYRLLANASKLKDTPRLDETNYRPNNNTALLDAVGRIITDFERGTTLADGDRVLLVIMTDGEENSSREYKLDTIRQMITERQAGGRWGVIFIGSGIDAWAQAQGLGISRASTVSVDNTPEGTRSAYAGVAAASAGYASGLTSDEAAEHIEEAKPKPKRLPLP
jgi:hypothetical protein